MHLLKGKFSRQCRCWYSQSDCSWPCVCNRRRYGVQNSWDLWKDKYTSKRRIDWRIAKARNSYSCSEWESRIRASDWILSSVKECWRPDRFYWKTPHPQAPASMTSGVFHSLHKDTNCRSPFWNQHCFISAVEVKQGICLTETGPV